MSIKHKFTDLYPQHYNLLRIFVYHWNLLFPGVMPPTSPKMDSTPPNRQQAPATTQVNLIKTENKISK